MAMDKRRAQVGRAAREARDVAGRAGEDVADRLGTAWKSLRNRRRDGQDLLTGTPPARPDSELDDHALFSRDRQQAVEQLGHANILVIGQTGVGKSTLINAIFRKPLA